MRCFYEEVLIPVGVTLIAMAIGILMIATIALAGSTATAHWNCSAWHKSTGEQTQVIAGDCYVKNGAKWEIFGTYVKNHHVDIREK